MNTPIIEVVENDPLYGTFWMECIGIVDYQAILKAENSHDWNSWYEKYYPRKYFSNCILEINLHDHIDKNGEDTYAGRIAVFVPTASANKEWSFKNCEYGKLVGGRKRPMPLIQSDKKIIKWQKGEFLKNSCLVPEWLSKCSTAEELIALDKLYNFPCVNCG